MTRHLTNAYHPAFKGSSMATGHPGRSRFVSAMSGSLTGGGGPAETTPGALGLRVAFASTKSTSQDLIVVVKMGLIEVLCSIRFTLTLRDFCSSFRLMMVRDYDRKKYM